MKTSIAAAVSAATILAAGAAATASGAQQLVTTSDGTYTLSFTAASADESVIFGLWNPPSYTSADGISLTTGGGANLLYVANWQNLGGPGYCCSGVNDDGSQAGDLTSGSYGPYTLFEQAVTGLTLGDSYNLTYTMNNTFGYSQLSTVAVPEPAAWGLMLLGLGLAGAAVRGRRSAVAT